MVLKGFERVFCLPGVTDGLTKPDLQIIEPTTPSHIGGWWTVGFALKSQGVHCFQDTLYFATSICMLDGLASLVLG